MLNKVDIELKSIYDGWSEGIEYEKNSNYSSMFRMGFPDCYINNGKPLIMYVGQECRDCTEKKTQEWVKQFQSIQFQEAGSLPWPFWRFYRLLLNICDGANVLWNNLDKFHRNTNESKRQPLPGNITSAINAPYGPDNLSVLQREIKCVKPDIIVFVIGPKEKYLDSLSAALCVDKAKLNESRPYKTHPASCIDWVLPNSGIKVFWTYHPKYLSLSKQTDTVIETIIKTVKDV